MRRSIRLLAPLAALALGASGCVSVQPEVSEATGFSDESLNDPKIPIGPGGQLDVETGEFYFVLTGTAVDGAITIDLDNIGGVIHNITIDNAAGETKAVEANGGEQASGELLLFGGTEYVFYCSIPGHRAAGMEGVLKVALEGDDGTVEIDTRQDA